MRSINLPSLLLLSAALSGPALAEQPTARDGYFVDSKGAALYTFDKDTDGKSVCRDTCAKNWPPAIAEQDDIASGAWTFVESHDGKRQWAYNGKPLYLFVKDAKRGDTTGDGVGGVWHLAKP